MTGLGVLTMLYSLDVLLERDCYEEAKEVIKKVIIQAEDDSRKK